ncbi:SLC13 family permease [Salinibius halmophilus]|uniref:SLC13 family permease n=1 Tax=Salinibius halmophilus TaxID=1853216 RepID=UPI000E66F31C|nr:DASS family sodium-coupled anion symporter [Salinibius halmophilus]
MATQTINRKSLKALIWLVFMLVFSAFQPFSVFGLNAAQNAAAIIVLTAAVLWVSEWVPLFVVSFLILAMELIWLSPLLAAQKASFDTQIFFAPFFSQIILLFLAGFVLSQLLQKYNLDIHFAHFLLRRSQGNPQRIILALIVAGAFLSMWMSNTATTAMMLAICMPLIRQLPAQDNYRTAIILAIPFACNLGGMGTPIGTAPNAIALSYLHGIGIQLSFAHWMLLAVPFMSLLLVILWRLLLWMYPSQTQCIELTKTHFDQFDGQQKFVIGIFAVTIFGWLFGGQIGLSTGMVSLLPIIASFWFGLLTADDFRSLSWDVLFMVAGGLALGVAVVETGLGEELVAFLPTGLAFPVLIVLVVVINSIASVVMSNTATAGLMIPVVISLPLPIMQVAVLVVMVTLSCSLGMVLPVSTPPNAIAFSSGVLTSKQLVRGGLGIALIGTLLLLILGPTYLQWVL